MALSQADFSAQPQVPSSDTNPATLLKVPLSVVLSAQEPVLFSATPKTKRTVTNPGINLSKNRKAPNLAVFLFW